MKTVQVQYTVKENFVETNKANIAAETKPEQQELALAGSSLDLE